MPFSRTSSWLLIAFLSLAATPLVRAWKPGARVIVEKAGAGHRAIVLQAESGRCFVAYEGVTEKFDEWVEIERVRSAEPLEQSAAPANPLSKENADKTSQPDSPSAPAVVSAAPAVPELLPADLELPRLPADAALAACWLEMLPRKNPNEPLNFNTAQMVRPVFTWGPTSPLPTTRPPLRAAAVQVAGQATGFVAIEDGLALYPSDARGGFTRAGVLDLKALQNFPPELLAVGDFDQNGITDLVVAGGPLVQVFFGQGGGRYEPSAKALRLREPVRDVVAGRFFPAPLGEGLAVLEGMNKLQLVRVSPSGLTVEGQPFQVKFDRVTRLVAGDFDGDGFSDLAIATEQQGRSTGAWMYFNQLNGFQPFLWPVGGRDDFARDLYVADLDRDGRDDLVLTDSDTERGAHVRVVFGSGGRAGWEDPWDLLSVEYGLGLGTSSVVVADFNGDGRLDIGVGGRNGLRVYLGADYRRFSRNPVWPLLKGRDGTLDARAFVAGDFDGDKRTDLVGYTPAFAADFSVLLNATVKDTPGVMVPRPKRNAPLQATTTLTTVVAGASANQPRLRALGSRAEPYGEWRYRIVVEVAALTEGVVESVSAVCRYDGKDAPLQEAVAISRRTGDERWLIEVVLPRCQDYTFTITARDDKGMTTEPLRVTVTP